MLVPSVMFTGINFQLTNTLTNVLKWGLATASTVVRCLWLFHSFKFPVRGYVSFSCGLLSIFVEYFFYFYILLIFGIMLLLRTLLGIQIFHDLTWDGTFSPFHLFIEKSRIWNVFLKNSRQWTWSKVSHVLL